MNYYRIYILYVLGLGSVYFVIRLGGRPSFRIRRSPFYALRVVITRSSPCRDAQLVLLLHVKSPSPRPQSHYALDTSIVCFLPAWYYYYSASRAYREAFAVVSLVHSAADFLGVGWVNLYRGWMHTEDYTENNRNGTPLNKRRHLPS